MKHPPRVLVTGATGFVGRHLCCALAAAGAMPKCASRNPAAASRPLPGLEWATLNVHSDRSVRSALSGCDAAYYLVHGLREGRGYPTREAEAAERFAATAQRSNLRRLVYLGAIQPRGEVSQHLRSRLRTGQILRERFDQSVELRASMIVGQGSAAFTLVRDFAARAPALPQPQWLLNRSCPVAIDDVVVALLAALLLPGLPPGSYDVPGPECLSHRNVVVRVAAQLRRRLPTIALPAFSPQWCARAAALLTGVDQKLAEQLLLGLQSDLAPQRRHTLWRCLPQHSLRPFDQAVADALADEHSAALPSPATRERLARLATDLCEFVGS